MQLNVSRSIIQLYIKISQNIKYFIVSFQKLYAKNKDAFGDFQLIADTPIESPEILYDVYSSAGSRRVGYFDSQNTINTYWATGSYTTASLDSTYILDSVYLSGSS